jgi:hypothetical protein
VDDQNILPAAASTVALETKSKDNKKPNSPGPDPKTGMIESRFLKKLRSTLEGRWPPDAAIRDGAKARDQMTAMFAALFNRLDLHEDLRKGPKGSAQRIVFEMLAGSDWPFGNKDFPVPRGWSGEKLLAFRRYEVSCAMAIFYRSFHRTGPMGSPREWPPKN